MIYTFSSILLTKNYLRLLHHVIDLFYYGKSNFRSEEYGLEPPVCLNCEAGI